MSKSKKPEKAMGRPPVDDPASVTIRTRATPAQADSYKQVAAEKGVTMSAWMKRELDRAVQRWRKKRSV